MSYYSLHLDTHRWRTVNLPTFGEKKITTVSEKFLPGSGAANSGSIVTEQNKLGIKEVFVLGLF